MEGRRSSKLKISQDAVAYNASNWKIIHKIMTGWSKNLDVKVY